MNDDKGNGNKEIMVSVWLLTYNHAQYIRDTFEGILMQKTNFAYEIVVFDDASTDGTSDIVREYAKKYPDVVIPYIQEKNTYGKPERQDIIRDIKKNRMCGKYMAFCEGDDYWIDENKLQIQVDYMESHPECRMTAHNHYKYNCETKEMNIANPYNEERIIFPKEILLCQRGNLATASLMIRREDSPTAALFYETGVGDWPQQLYSLTQGTVYYFNRVMSVYRLQVENSWSSDIFKDKKKYVLHSVKMIRFLRKYNAFTNYKYEKYIKCRISEYVFNIILLEGGVDVLKEMLPWENDLQNLIRKILSNICKIERIRTEKEISEELRDYILCHEKIYLYGTGEYATVIADCFLRQKIKYSGFVETVKTKENFMGHRVFSLADINSKEDDFGIVFATGTWHWSSIMETLEQSGINDYYIPYVWEE